MRTIVCKILAIVLLVTFANIIIAQPKNLAMVSKIEKEKIDDELLVEVECVINATNSIVSTSSNIADISIKERNTMDGRKNIGDFDAYAKNSGSTSSYYLLDNDEKILYAYTDYDKGIYEARFYGNFKDGIDVVYMAGDEIWHDVLKSNSDDNSTIVLYTEFGNEIIKKCDVTIALDVKENAGNVLQN